MKRIHFIVFILIFTLSCSEKESVIDLKSSTYCDNQLNLLNSFDTVQTLIADFQSIDDSLKQNLSKLYNDDICCKDLRFNIIHFIDSVKSIKLTLNYYYNCNNCPTYIRERSICVILQNSRGQILFDRRLINIDSLDYELKNYYTQTGKSDSFPDIYDKVNISIQWDKGVSKENFTKLINKIILGYLNSVDSIANINFHKELCQLNQVELSKISKLIPLNIELQIPRKLKLKVKTKKFFKIETK